jgi:hypothetical protein
MSGIPGTKAGTASPDRGIILPEDVDVTVLGLGRDVARIQRLAAHTPLQLVVATGLYTYHELPLYFHFRGPGTLFGGPDGMADLFVRDITEGIAGTGVKAAILKCATEVAGLRPGVERVVRAVAQAHRQTGVPITTRTGVPLGTAGGSTAIWGSDSAPRAPAPAPACSRTANRERNRRFRCRGSESGSGAWQPRPGARRGARQRP